MGPQYERITNHSNGFLKSKKPYAEVEKPEHPFIQQTPFPARCFSPYQELPEKKPWLSVIRKIPVSANRLGSILILLFLLINVAFSSCIFRFRI